MGNRILLTAALVAGGVGTANAATVVLEQSPDWAIGNFDASTGGSTDPANTPNISYGYENGPATPPVGPESFFTEVNGAGEKVILGYTGLNGTRLDAIDELSFFTYIDSASTNGKGNDTFNWYANVWLDYDDDGAFDQRVDFIATNENTDTWAEYDVAGSGSTGSRSGNVPLGTTFDSIIADNPDAKIIGAFSDPNNAGFVLNMGDTGNTYEGFVGNLDAVTVTVNGNETVFDLAVPEPASLSAIALLSVATLRRRR